jgi:hypothetical protein
LFIQQHLKLPALNLNSVPESLQNRHPTGRAALKADTETAE